MYYNEADYNNNLGYADNEYEVESDTTENTGSVYDLDEEKLRRKMIRDAKLADKGYHYVRREINSCKVKTDHFGSINIPYSYKVKLEYYETRNVPGAKIRDALTGTYMNALVGSRDEDLFFKVLVCTGETGQNPPLLFYDSINDYERHNHCKVSDTIRDKWMEKNRQARLYLYTEQSKQDTIVK